MCRRGRSGHRCGRGYRPGRCRRLRNGRSRCWSCALADCLVSISGLRTIIVARCWRRLRRGWRSRDRRRRGCRRRGCVLASGLVCIARLGAIVVPRMSWHGEQQARTEHRGQHSHSQLHRFPRRCLIGGQHLGSTRVWINLNGSSALDHLKAAARKVHTYRSSERPQQPVVGLGIDRPGARFNRICQLAALNDAYVHHCSTKDAGEYEAGVIGCDEQGLEALDIGH